MSKDGVIFSSSLNVLFIIFVSNLTVSTPTIHIISLIPHNLKITDEFATQRIHRSSLSFIIKKNAIRIRNRHFTRIKFNPSH